MGTLALEEERSAANTELADGHKNENPGFSPETSGFSPNPSFLKVMVDQGIYIIIHIYIYVLYTHT